MVTDCIMNSQVNFKKDSTNITLYDYGMYGPCFGFTNRFEYQQRGTIHLHQLLYFQKEQNGQLSSRLLEFWAAAFSLWNFKRNADDKLFIMKYQITHTCSDDCLTNDVCRKGFPMKLNNKAFWKSEAVNLIYPRVQEQSESNIFMHDREVVKIFNSSCVIESCGSEQVVNYITKYLHKDSNSLKQDFNNTENSETIKEENVDLRTQNQQVVLNIGKDENYNQEQDDTNLMTQQQNLRQKATDLLHQVISKKITSLQEALADLMDYPIFKTSFTTIKLSQVSMNEQFQINHKTFKQVYNFDEPEEDFNAQIKQSLWLKYLSRPEELELLNLNEYVQNFIWYGNKKKYKKKSEQQSNLYFVDQNGQTIKEREKAVEVILQLSQCYYIEDIDYEPNLYYLAMLQMFWPHRQSQWLLETNDTHQGFKQFYYKLYGKIEGERQQTINPSSNLKLINNNYFEKYCVYRSFKTAVDNYKSITPNQKRFLAAINFTPKKFRNQNTDKIKEENQQISKRFIQNHLLLRAKNLIIKLGGLLQQVEQSYQFDGIRKVLNYLRPDILINIEQREQIIQVENNIINYLSNWNEVPQIFQNIILQFGSLLKCQNFNNLSSQINKCTQNYETPIRNNKSNMFKTVLENQIDWKISQNEISIFNNYEDENIQFPQHFRTKLSRSELKQCIRPKIAINKFTQAKSSNKLSNMYLSFTSHQRLAILIALQYLFKSQVLEDLFAVYESCLIHGGGGVGKSFIIEFLIDFFEEIDESFYILCPTQVAVQNIMKDRNNQHNIMTIHSFFTLSPQVDIETCYDHFMAFLKFINKDQVLQISTDDLYPELTFYNCMNRVERFTLKLKGVHCIVKVKLQWTYVFFFFFFNNIILEEISMMPPKFLTLLDIYLQVSLNNSQTFGGVQVFAFGDSFQLQPVTHPPTYYFQTHVFTNGYFSTCLELNIAIRQAEDQEFYSHILQPFRMGKFQTHPLYQASFRKLKMRHLSENINNESGYSLASGLQAQVQRLQVENQITFLYFDNQAVTKENQQRADQHIMQLSLNQHYENQKFRQFLNSPARLSFGVKSFKEDLLLMNLSENFEISDAIFKDNQQISYALHFKLLPLSVRNYVVKKLLPEAYELIKRNEKHSQSFPLYIKLFCTAKVIFRKNLIKELKMINGQSATITDIQFEIDQKNENQLLIQNKKKQEIIESYLQGGLIPWVESKEYQQFNLSHDFIIQARSELEFEEWNNINSLRDDDILESEKLGFIPAGIQPRLKSLSFQIQGSPKVTHLQNVEQYYQEVNIQMPSIRIKGILREALNSIKRLQGLIGKSKTLSTQNLQEITENAIKQDQNLLFMFGLDILRNNLNSHLFIQTQTHLEGLLNKINDELTPMKLSQLPINLGYARTIHTSQGATFENACVTIDSNHLNRPGLLYTAFSRVRNLQQLFLQGDFDEDIFSDNVPEDLRKFFEQNFVQADDILQSKYFQNLIDINKFGFADILQYIVEHDSEIRRKLLRQLPKKT